MYRWGFLNIFAPFKWIFSNTLALFRPMMRGPFTKSAIQTVAVKSAALAAENFVLAITAQGYSTCMMEGFDEWRVARFLRLSCSSRVVMVIAIGKEDPRGIWGPSFRLPLSQVVKEV
jgi:nitroreductase